MLAASPEPVRAYVGALEQALRDFTARLGKDSTNSSKPPSSDPPHAKPAPARKPTGKRRGGPPEHPRGAPAGGSAPAHAPARRCRGTHFVGRQLHPPVCLGCATPLAGRGPARGWAPGPAAAPASPEGSPTAAALKPAHAHVVGKPANVGAPTLRGSADRVARGHDARVAVGGPTHKAGAPTACVSVFLVRLSADPLILLAGTFETLSPPHLRGRGRVGERTVMS